jgi:hypothetical protein
VYAALGRVEESSCASSLFATPSGLVVAGARHEHPFSASGAPDAETGWVWTEGPAAEPGVLNVELHEPDGRLIQSLKWPAPGDPVAGSGSTSDFTLALSAANQLSLLLAHRDGFSLFQVENEPCVAASSVALGQFGDDVVVAYYCNRFVRNDSDEAQHLIIARAIAASGELEKTILDVVVGDAMGRTQPGTPAATWADGEFLFAHGTAVSGQMALTRVGADLVPHTELLTGTPNSSVNAGDYDPVYSVVQVADQIGVSRSACNGHEDAGPTGSVTLCTVSTSSAAAACWDVEAPCSGAKLVANGSAVTLLGCPQGGAATVVPLELTSPPAPGEAQFPAGYTDFTPLALTCTGDGCSALVAVNGAELTTGYDRRVAQVDTKSPALCSDGPGAPCNATTAITLTDVVSATHIRGDYRSSNIEVEQQPGDFPLGFASVLRDGIQTVPTLSSLDRGGSIRWSEPVLDDIVFFNEGDSYRGLGGRFTTTMLNQFLASASGVADEPYLDTGRTGSPPGIAHCDGRYFVHGTTVPSSVTERETPAIYAFAPQDGATTLLFDPGVVAQTSGKAPPTLGCAGSRLFLLDGLVLHRYLESGEREPDIQVASPPPSGTNPYTLRTRLETHRDYALALSVNEALNELDALFLYPDRRTRAFALPLPEGILPLAALMSANDVVDGWLNVLYESATTEPPDVRWGTTFTSAYRLPIVPPR